jgi:hypothetical protein
MRLGVVMPSEFPESHNDPEADSSEMLTVAAAHHRHRALDLEVGGTGLPIPVRRSSSV